ncbi:DUF4870 domain-containing protein [Luteolibacter ambystomatis]|uniref:DUF4870 domain-containing protein n=1 Tax=Luteolibacter ambystomatis TaxID=2824561 RepID=A0A975J137_9BACT|nr:DUF4870 domain-containing protein [Luteolibacter ambystomatis]QUE52052.1 DUF4870 domain-containing protein [Luteolibacter ambystomatis]
MESDTSMPPVPPPMVQPPAAPPMLPQPPPALPPGMMIPSPTYPLSTEEERTMGLLCHLLPIFTGFLGPLILWLVRKDQSRYIDHHGREALNFQITKLIYLFSGGALMILLMFLGGIGIVLFPVLFIVAILMLVAEIMAAIAANRGEWYRYPCCIRVL